jgi:hypothetical protein
MLIASKMNKWKQNLVIGALVATAAFFYHCSGPVRMGPEDFSAIQQAFTTPHDTNTVWCYYYWIGDDISKYGVTKDMEAMKEFGIGAALIGNINPAEVDGPVPLFSDEWWDITVHAVNEGHRLGIDVGFFNCPGWSQSGGPWVDYEKAMRHMVYSEAQVRGPGMINITMAQPANEFQDSYVLAFKSIEAEGDKLGKGNSVITSNPSLDHVERLIDGDVSSEALFSLSGNKTYTIDIVSEEPVTARSITLYPGQPEFKCDCELYVRNGDAYTWIDAFVFDRSNSSVQVGALTHGPLALALPEVRSDAFRLVCTNFSSNSPEAGFAEIVISAGVVLEKYVEKSLGKMHPTPFPENDSYMWDMQAEIFGTEFLVSEVIDLSDKMSHDGQLSWDAPEGSWTILRMGMTPTGTTNAPAAPQGKGYEIDKASEELIRFHFEQFIAEIIRRVPEESLPALKYVIADSYEQGSQNWTDNFEQRFEEKYGYNPVRYLPVFSGRVVGSVDESERFLWDLRRGMADDIAYKYVGGLRRISNEHGLKLWLENYGHWGFPAEFLMYGGQSDLVAGEFWNEGKLGDVECKSASSAAHIYGKPVTSAEVFTAAWQGYTRHPALLKKRGDWSFTEGINHYVLHLYIHQPDDIRIPGINADFSTEFNRHNTWFKQGKHWVDYARRCQHLLQQGKYAADVIYYIGEDVPKMTGKRNPELPSGYAYDYINAEVILERLTVRDGRFFLPDGMSYSLLVLPDLKTMRPEVLAKIEQLVKSGGAVLGPKPEQSPSLQNYPAADIQVKEIASRLWAGPYENGKLIHRFGRGHLLDGLSIQESLDLIGVDKDVDFGIDADVLWTHRTMPGMDIYFLTNQSEEKVSMTPSFRIKGRKPQLWDAVSGEIRYLNDYNEKDGRTHVPITLNPLESWFVVFSSQTSETVGRGYQVNFPEAETIIVIDNEWKVEFHNKEIGPQEPLTMTSLSDWTASGDVDVRYYSGTATYRTVFFLQELPESGQVFLNLGHVGVMAEVTLNGENLGGRWMSPFVFPVMDILKKGENELKIDVVNVWRNRMVKDLMLPEEERYTWFIAHDIVPGEELIPSGLLGPVQLQLIQYE